MQGVRVAISGNVLEGTQRPTRYVEAGGTASSALPFLEGNASGPSDGVQFVELRNFAKKFEMMRC